ncbi:ankyrin repeat domain-containing protein 50-like [Haliotis cracherodii]|uniref:ankyrin repeat domain-containing protein 50-like n=1 Tax=Haliotis cracherodii TaxID=6455 RepID=UPI0039E940E2
MHEKVSQVANRKKAGSEKKTDRISQVPFYCCHKVSSKHCTAKVCNLTRRCLEIGSGKAVRVQATPTASPRLPPADAKLHSACLSGDLLAVRRILSVGQADINCRKNSRTPVMTAAIKGSGEVVELLVSYGADVSLVDKNSDNILHLACWRGKMEVVNYVLSQCLVNIDARGSMKLTAVMKAAKNGHREVMKLLVSEGADVSLVDNSGNNILHIVCLQSDLEAVKYVLSQDMVGINDRGEYERTPVMRAAEKGYKEVVELLVHKGADVTLVDKDGNNILHLACQKNNVELVKYVLSQDMVGINDRGVYERTPVMRAARNGYKEVVELLVHKGADVTLVDKDGNNILHLACQKNNVEMVKYVLSQDMVGINDRGWYERTPVMRAAEKGYKEVVELLVHKGADVTLVDKDGNNILHLACQKNNVEVVKYILSQDMVGINDRGVYERTPVMRAAKKGYKEMWMKTVITSFT